MLHSEQFDDLAPNTGLPALVGCTFNELRGAFLLLELVFRGLSDAIEASTFGSLTLHHEIEFIIDFDIAVTPSSLF